MSRKCLVSACLIGKPCAYDGRDRYRDDIGSILKGFEAVPVCPEVSGGLTCPRETHEICNGSGKDVLDGKAKVISVSGKDRSKEFISGARQALSTAKDNRITAAFLKARSPSCGKGEIYDGSFSSRTRPGNGVTASLLQRNGIEVIAV